MTKRTPKIRARELSAVSGIPTPFVVSFSRKVWNPRRVEVLCHQALASSRVNRNREFFKTTTDIAKKNIVKFSKGGKKRTVLPRKTLSALMFAAIASLPLLGSKFELIDFADFSSSIYDFLQVLAHLLRLSS